MDSPRMFIIGREGEGYSLVIGGISFGQDENIEILLWLPRKTTLAPLRVEYFFFFKSNISKGASEVRGPLDVREEIAKNAAPNSICLNWLDALTNPTENLVMYKLV